MHLQRSLSTDSLESHTYISQATRLRGNHTADEISDDSSISYGASKDTASSNLTAHTAENESTGRGRHEDNYYTGASSRYSLRVTYVPRDTFSMSDHCNDKKIVLCNTLV